MLLHQHQYITSKLMFILDSQLKEKSKFFILKNKKTKYFDLKIKKPKL